MSYDRNDYADTNCPDAPVPPHLSILRCDHRKEASVKQSRQPSTAARAYYCCPYKSVSNKISHVWILCNLTLISFFLVGAGSCRLFQWIDGPELIDRQILLFSYDRNESSPLRSFKRWVPLSPNPPPMTDEEKDEASTSRARNPPACKYGYRAELDYTPFFRCLISLSVILDNILYILLWLKYLVYVNEIDMCCVL
jgi:hypothetical protein